MIGQSHEIEDVHSASYSNKSCESKLEVESLQRIITSRSKRRTYSNEHPMNFLRGRAHQQLKFKLIYYLLYFLTEVLLRARSVRERKKNAAVKTIGDERTMNIAVKKDLAEL